MMGTWGVQAPRHMYSIDACKRRVHERKSPKNFARTAPIQHDLRSEAVTVSRYEVEGGQVCCTCQRLHAKPSWQILGSIRGKAC